MAHLGSVSLKNEDSCVLRHQKRALVWRHTLLLKAGCFLPSVVKTVNIYYLCSSSARFALNKKSDTCIQPTVRSRKGEMHFLFKYFFLKWNQLVVSSIRDASKYYWTRDQRLLEKLNKYKGIRLTVYFRYRALLLLVNLAA